MDKQTEIQKWARMSVRRMLVRVYLSISTDYALLAKLAGRK